MRYAIKYKVVQRKACVIFGKDADWAIRVRPCYKEVYMPLRVNTNIPGMNAQRLGRINNLNLVQLSLIHI